MPRALDSYAPDAGAFAEAIGVAGALAPKVYDRVRDKLRREPVEDFRIAASSATIGSPV